MDLNLPVPISKDSPSFIAWINDNLRIFKEAFVRVPAIRTGTNNVTGSATIATGLTRVDRVVASFHGDASAGAMALSARPSATQGAILIKVFDSTASASTAPINVSWAAYGIE